MGIYTDRKLFGTTRKSASVSEGSNGSDRRGFSEIVILSVVSSFSIKTVRAIGSFPTGGKIRGGGIGWAISARATTISAFVRFLRFTDCRLFSRTAIKPLRIARGALGSISLKG